MSQRVRRSTPAGAPKARPRWQCIPGYRGAPRVKLKSNDWAARRASGLRDYPRAGQTAEKSLKFVFRRLILAGMRFALRVNSQLSTPIADLPAQ